jgi:DNA-binding beta-propeller fold protein YncE
VVSDPYAGKVTKIEANLVFGEIGQNPGQFDAPRGLAFAPDGSLYVADSRNHRIQHFDAEGNFINQWGTFGDLLNTGQAPIGTFDEPWGVAVGPDGSVYVSDTWNHRIQKFSAEGKAIKMWGIFGLAADAPDALYGPRGISIDSAGHIFVADTGNKRIVIFDSEGNLLNSFGSEGVDVGQFYEPVDVKIGPDGNAYVTDTWNHRVQVFAPSGADGFSFTPLLQWEVSGWLSETLDNKPYIAIAPNGHVFVTDPEGYRVIEFTNDGKVVRVWGDYGAENFAFTLPSGIISDAAGNIWVTDAGYNRVMRFTLP